MLFRIFAKPELKRLYETLAGNHVVGPVSRGIGRQGEEKFAFDCIFAFDDLRLDFSSTVQSVKRFVLPFREVVTTFRVADRDWSGEIDPDPHRPMVFFGLHACDINALNKLDKVLLHGTGPDPFYAARRANLFIIGIGCTPLPSCFCRSMAADTALSGFDMFLTDLGDHYFVEILSSAAFNLLKSIETTEPAAEDHQRYLEVVARRNRAFTCEVDTTDLTKILDLEFQSEVWHHWGEKCLSCGTCASVCPTCYCYGVREEVDTDLKGAVKIKQLYSCNLIDFAAVAGGHNFRPQSHTRLKYRYYHKHRGFQEAFEEPLCVGCGRCGRACLAEITVPAVIASVRQGELNHG